jgi:hypothetical protein
MDKKNENTERMVENGNNNPALMSIISKSSVWEFAGLRFELCKLCVCRAQIGDFEYQEI